jgi:hypothetical protein
MELSNQGLKLGSQFQEKLSDASKIEAEELDGA